MCSIRYVVLWCFFRRWSLGSTLFFFYTCMCLTKMWPQGKKSFSKSNLLSFISFHQFTKVTSFLAVCISSKTGGREGLATRLSNEANSKVTCMLNPKHIHIIWCCTKFLHNRECQWYMIHVSVFPRRTSSSPRPVRWNSQWGALNPH